MAFPMITWCLAISKRTILGKQRVRTKYNKAKNDDGSDPSYRKTVNFLSSSEMTQVIRYPKTGIYSVLLHEGQQTSSSKDSELSSCPYHFFFLRCCCLIMFAPNQLVVRVHKLLGSEQLRDIS